MAKKIDLTQIRYSGRRISPGNANMRAVADAAALFNVPAFRMQSRTFTVKGRGGADRPMFIGGWVDDCGRQRTKGMSDYLLTPQITISGVLRPVKVCVALWVECKAGRDELSQDQMDFRDYVTKAGAFWICCINSCEELLEWFEDFGVVRR
jgi:hypothetical protein